MAAYWADPDLGSDANPGTEALPKRSIPHAQAGKNWSPAVVSGDVVNIKVGTSWDPGPLAGDRFVPITGVTYQGYGSDSNSRFWIEQPLWIHPRLTYRVLVGSGTWRVNGFSCGAGFQAALIGTTGRINVTMRDMWIDGAGADASSQVELGNNNATSGGIVFQRCRFSNAPKVGITNFLHASGGAAAQALLMEDCLIERAGEDLFKFNAATNFCIGTHTFRRIDMRHPNWNAALGTERPQSEVYGSIAGGNGDVIQVQTTPGRFEGAVLIEDFFARKEGVGKQWLVLFDAINGWTVRRFHVAGAGTKYIAIGQIRGPVKFSRGYFGPTTSRKAALLFRMNPIDPGDVISGPTNTALNAIYGNSGTPGVDAIYNCALSTARIDIDHCVADEQTGAMFLTLFEPQTSGPVYRVGCPVTVTNCTSIPTDVSDYGVGTIGSAGGYDPATVGAQIALWTSRVVYDGHASANSFSLTVRDNALLKTGIASIRQPNGTLNDARFAYRNNGFAGTPTLWLQNVTQHAGVTAMQAAHSQATGNVQDIVVSPSGIPLFGSPLLTAGSTVGLRRDIRGVQGQRYIGAYAPATLKRFAGAA